MVKTKLSWGMTVLSAVFLLIIGIPISALFVGSVINGQMTILNFLLGFLFLGLLPTLYGIYILVGRSPGGDYDFNELENNPNLPWHLRLMRLIAGLTGAGMLFLLFIVLNLIRTEIVWLSIVLFIFKELLVVAILANVLIAAGRTKYYQKHKDKIWMRMLLIVAALCLFVLANILINLMKKWLT